MLTETGREGMMAIQDAGQQCSKIGASIEEHDGWLHALSKAESLWLSEACKDQLQTFKEALESKVMQASYVVVDAWSVFFSWSGRSAEYARSKIGEDSFRQAKEYSDTVSQLHCWNVFETTLANRMESLLRVVHMWYDQAEVMLALMEDNPRILSETEINSIIECVDLASFYSHDDAKGSKLLIPDMEGIISFANTVLQVQVSVSASSSLKNLAESVRPIYNGVVVAYLRVSGSIAAATSAIAAAPGEAISASGCPMEEVQEAGVEAVAAAVEEAADPAAAPGEAIAALGHMGDVQDVHEDLVKVPAPVEAREAVEKDTEEAPAAAIAVEAVEEAVEEAPVAAVAGEVVAENVEEAPVAAKTGEAPAAGIAGEIQTDEQKELTAKHHKQVAALEDLLFRMLFYYLYSEDFL
jgi:hypothetical protein